MQITLVAFMVWAGAGPVGQVDLPLYVGRSVCLECHSKGQDAGACAVRHVPRHLGAVDVLANEASLEIAALSGLPGPPQKSVHCLSCHATGAEEGPRWHANSFDASQGVSCEACHGAGSRHGNYYRTVPPGSPNETPSSLRVVDRWYCGTCHRDMPSHHLVLEQGFARSPADHRYKTPVNLRTSPDGALLYVVCTDSNSLVVLDTNTGRTVGTAKVGRRPHDVAVSPDGSLLFVSNRLDDTVTVIGATDLEIQAVIAVGDEPHGLITDAAGERLFVLNTEEDSISVVDVATRMQVRRLVTGRGPWSLALDPDGDSLCVTSVRPQPSVFREPHHSELAIVSTVDRVVTRRPVVPGANMIKGVAFVMNGPHRGVALFVMMRSKNLVPATRLAQGWTITNALGVLFPDGTVDQVLLDEPAGSFADPNDVAISPDGRHALVTSGGSDQVAVIDVAALVETIAEASPMEREHVLPNHLGYSSRFVLKRVKVGGNPRGVTFAPDGRRAYVACALDDTITVIDTADFTVRRTLDLGGPPEITELRRGEKLFHSAAITFAGQFSCQSCHPDGHITGLTIDIEADGIGMRPVDNRTLRGIVDTAPFKWEGTNPSLHRQCGPRLAVFFTRLAPYSPDELTALVRYMCTIERPPNRYRPAGGLTAAQYRGKIVFDRRLDNNGQPIPDAGRCITCHNGAQKTAQTKAPVRSTMWFDKPHHLDFEPEHVFNSAEFGDLGTYFFAETNRTATRFDVPHLSNIYDSAPYLHNGSANTLEEIWTVFNMLEGHGLTRDLTRQQFNDLIAYLRAL